MDSPCGLKILFIIHKKTIIIIILPPVLHHIWAWMCILWSHLMATAAVSCEKQLKIGFIFSSFFISEELSRSPGDVLHVKTCRRNDRRRTTQKLVLQSDTQSSHCRINMVKIMLIISASSHSINNYSSPLFLRRLVFVMIAK